MKEAKEFIARLAEENREFYGSAKGRGALKDLQQSFPHPWIYVAELLQNAVDEGASSIRFIEPNPGVLVLEHNGKSFDQRDVEGICTKGVSAKGAGTVGFMGVGFKAVFRSFQTVIICSRPWQFRLQAKITMGKEYGDQQRDWMGTVIPVWDEKAPVPSPDMTCRFEMRDRIEGLKDIAGDFDTVFRTDYSLMALLAIREVKEIHLFGTTWLLDVKGFKTNENSQHCTIQAVDDETDTLRQWVLFRREYEPSREAVRRFLEHRAINPSQEEKEKVYSDAARTRRVELFFSVDENGFPNLPEKGEVFALLPTNQSLPFGAHINADWLLTVTRMEFMDVEETDDLEGNAWQEAIRNLVPELIRDYLKWLDSDEINNGTWQIAYRIFPTTLIGLDTFGRWLLGNDFREKMRQLLLNVPFLPGLTNANGQFEFLTPSVGRTLPNPLADVFENDDGLRSFDLFNNNIVDTSILGEKASKSLKELEIIKELSAQELKSYWGKTRVSEWYKGFPEKERMPALYKLVKALSAIGSDSWVEEDLVCLPTEGPSWISRENAVRFPAEWGIVVNETKLVQALLPFVGEKNKILDRKFDSYAQNQNGWFWSHDFPIPQKTFDNVVEDWWNSLPSEGLTQTQIDTVVLFTCWVQAKQSNRRSLVPRLLAKKRNNIKLLPCNKTFLTTPYAGNFRKVFFPNHPSVLQDYYEKSVRDADWKAFLESGNSIPQGKFNVHAAHTSLSYNDAQKALGKEPPNLRVTSCEVACPIASFIRISNGKYVHITFTLREDVIEKLNQGADEKYLRAFAQWIEESPKPLRAFPKERLYYIPYGSSSAAEETLRSSARWVNQLNENSWVLAKDGTGPYKPGELLKEPDPARPEARVADLTTGLIDMLEEAGVYFETGIPMAEACRRLQFEGPRASLDVLADLLEEAIAELDGDENRERELIQILENTPLFPVPTLLQLIDGAGRVPGRRLVLKTGTRHRSNLDWVVAIDDFQEGTTENRIFTAAQKICTVPDHTSAVHCMDFLEWVWEKQPEADSVRHLLPRAYSYLFEDFRNESSIRERWSSIRRKGCVYTLGRRWVTIQGSAPVYYDDIGITLLSDVVLRTQIATAGHLGSRDNETRIPDGVSLLELPLLSSRYQVQSVMGETIDTPSLWQDRFEELQDFLSQVTIDNEESERAITGDFNELEENSGYAPLSLKSVSEIAQVVVDIQTGAEIRRVTLWAKQDEDSVVVTGNPSDFASELCQILLKYFALGNGDNSTLALEVAVLIVLIGSDDFDNHMDTIKPKFGISSKVARRTDEETRTDADTSKKGREPRKGSEDGTGKRTGGPETTRDEKKKITDAGTGSHTAEDRERKIRGLEKRIEELKASGLLNDSSDELESGGGENPTDERYRNAVIIYEKDKGRYAELKGSLQKGHDIDSFTDPAGFTNRKLVRRIEVKGRSHSWDGSETVELSKDQFKDALHKTVESVIDLSPDFDYWVYVVEDLGGDRFRILPMKNPALNSSKFELRGGTWRHFIEEESEIETDSKAISSKRRSILDLKDDFETDEIEEEDEDIQ